MEKTAPLKSLRGPIVLGAAVFVATALASIPASAISFIVNNSGGAFSYREAKGTIWNAELGSAAVAGVPLGDVTYRLSPLSLLRLSPTATVSTNGAVKGTGIVSFGPGARTALKDVNAEIDLGVAAARGLLGEPARGAAKIDVRRVDFSRKKGCIHAEGDLWTDALNAPAERFNLPALPMSGGVSCDESGNLVVTLAGENADTSASIRLLVDRTLAYEVMATAQPSEEGVASALRVFGFEDDNGALTYGTVGVLTGAGS